MKTIKLSKPITINQREVSELTFREATVGDLIAGETVGGNSRTAQVVATLASMADISYAEFKTISAKDFARINDETAALVGNEEPAGAS